MPKKFGQSTLLDKITIKWLAWAVLKQFLAGVVPANIQESIWEII